jgi:hypothetical protein
MKTLNRIFVLCLIILSSCKGSDTYQGNWKATDSNGNKLEIAFLPNSFSLKDSTGSTSEFDYKQNSVSIENSVETYGITLSDGRTYSITFPIANDVSRGVISDGGGNPLYAISRKEYIRYEDIYSLK